MIPRHLLDAIELLVALGVVGLLPGLGALDDDLVAIEDLTQALRADLEPVLDQVVAELAQAPVGERRPQFLGTGGGRLDDERLVVTRDSAGRPPAHLGSWQAMPTSLNL